MYMYMCIYIQRERERDYNHIISCIYLNIDYIIYIITYSVFIVFLYIYRVVYLQVCKFGFGDKKAGGGDGGRKHGPCEYVECRLRQNPVGCK